MGRTPVRDRIKLARRCMDLSALAEAASTVAIGFESACLLARYVTPRTERAWIERARVRTYKHLELELRAAEQDARLLGREGKDVWPPSEEEMADHEEFERGVISGAIVEEVMNERKRAAAEAEIRIEEVAEVEWSPDDAEDGSIRISTEPDGLDPDLRELANRLGEALNKKRRRHRKGETRLRWRAHRLEARMFRVAREIYRRLGSEVPLIVAMCIWFWETWLGELRAEISKYDGIHKRDGYKCASPGCFRRLCTLHHILRRILGGDDRWENLLTLCEVCHLKNIHERGSLQVYGKAPDDLTFVFGEVPHLVVRGREKRPAAA